MHLPSFASLFFLAYLLAFLPWMAWKSSRQARELLDPQLDLSNSDIDRIWIGTWINLLLMGALAWWIGGTFEFPFWSLPSDWKRASAAGCLALFACFLLRGLALLLYSEDERKRLFVYVLVPRTRRHWLFKTFVIITAGISEEIAYRGVGWAILDYSLGNTWVAIAISSLAFGLGHAVQGGKSAAIIVVFALIMHLLYRDTHSLIPCMCVHIVYDFVAMSLIARDAARFGCEPANLSQPTDPTDAEQAD